MQVIEAVIEHIPLKQQIFQELEAVCSKECILSTNTSTIDINVCAAKMKEPHRIVGPSDPTFHIPHPACSLLCASLCKLVTPERASSLDGFHH